MKLSDDSIINENDELVFISFERFLTDISIGNNCFLCGKHYSSGKSKEHVIPNWILREFDLHDKYVTLPNGTKLRYSSYVVPCCDSCNGILSKELEEPISRLFAKGIDAVADYVEKNGSEKLIVWMCLIFTKTHLKDERLGMHLDQRVSKASIADGVEHDRELFHHIYCLARAPYTNAHVTKDALGSFILFPVEDDACRENFDFIDLSRARTFGLVFNGIGIIVVFGDAGATLGALSEEIQSRVKGTLNHIQFRELVARFACCRLHLKSDPKFATVYDGRRTTVFCSTPDFFPEYEAYDPLLLGAFMKHLIWPINSGDSPDSYEEKLTKGEITFLPIP
jgi:hypothetical protein